MANELESKLQRLIDIQEIMDLQYRYLFYFSSLNVDKIMACFSKAPNVSSELGNKGKYVGFDAIRQTFQDKYEDSLKIPGLMGNIMAINPVIEVGQDGKTASGLWYAFGPIAVPFKNNEITAMWLSGKYEVDYIKEDGEWKFLHLHFILIFRCEIDKGWVQQPEAVHHIGLASIQSNNDVSEHKPYSPLIFNPFLPLPPEKNK